MTKVLDIFPKVKARAGDAGIEIEVEGKKSLPPDLTSTLIENWEAKPDGTLRGGFGVEYVARQPFYLNNAFEKKVSALIDHIRRVDVNEDSVNTSVHVHLNKSHSTMMGVLNCATAWWLLENILVNYCGPDREANMFCLRLADAEAIVPRLIKTLEQFSFERDLNDSYRYAALNIKALKDHGSLEVRSMRGVLASGVICQWVREVHTMFSRAEQFRNPEDIFNFLLKNTKQTFIRHFFSSDFANTLMTIPDWQNKLDHSAVLVCNFAYGLEWPQWEKQLAEWVQSRKPKGKLKSMLGWNSNESVTFAAGSTIGNNDYITAAVSDPPIPPANYWIDDISDNI